MLCTGGCPFLTFAYIQLSLQSSYLGESLPGSLFSDISDDLPHCQIRMARIIFLFSFGMAVSLFTLTVNANDCFVVENATCTEAGSFIHVDRPCFSCDCNDDGIGYTCCPNIETPNVRYPRRCDLLLDEENCEYKLRPSPLCFSRACDIITK